GVDLAARKLVLIPEAVAVAQALKLIGDDGVKERADACAGDVIFGQAANPEVDVVNGAVKVGQGFLKLRIGRDVVERIVTSQVIGFAGGVVIGQPVIAAA